MRTRYCAVFLIVLFAFVFQTEYAGATRCRPYGCQPPKVTLPRWLEDCVVPGPEGPETVDCLYVIYTYTCKGVCCDLDDLSMYYVTDCTIDDQPPGNRPYLPPTDTCDSDGFVSYMWQVLFLCGGDAGCSAICWQCEPYEIPTKTLAEARCKDLPNHGINDNCN